MMEVNENLSILFSIEQAEYTRATRAKLSILNYSIDLHVLYIPGQNWSAESMVTTFRNTI